MRRITTITTAAVAVALLASALVISATGGTDAGATEAERPVTGYTLFSNESGTTCELVTVEWATGAVTDLPAAPSADACVFDMAVAPDGTVHGLRIDLPAPGSVPPSTSPTGILAGSVGSLVTFAADGTPTLKEMTLPFEYALDVIPTSVLFGLAIDSTGVVNVIVNGLWANITDCSPGLVPAAAGLEPTDGIYDWTSCLFTLDPSTGDLTLVGPSRVTADMLGLSIGSEGSWSLLYPSGHVPVDMPTEANWSRVDRTTGEVTPTASTYGTLNGFYDQLRTRSTVFAFLRDPSSESPAYFTGTVDPTSGTMTPIARVQATPPQLRTVLAVIETPDRPTPEPVTPEFTG